MPEQLLIKDFLKKIDDLERFDSDLVRIVKEKISLSEGGELQLDFFNDVILEHQTKEGLLDNPNYKDEVYLKSLKDICGILEILNVNYNKRRIERLILGNEPKEYVKNHDDKRGAFIERSQPKEDDE